jgi:hypothetical protein
MTDIAGTLRPALPVFASFLPARAKNILGGVYLKPLVLFRDKGIFGTYSLFLPKMA